MQGTVQNPWSENQVERTAPLIFLVSASPLHALLCSNQLILNLDAGINRLSNNIFYAYKASPKRFHLEGVDLLHQIYENINDNYFKNEFITLIFDHS